MTQDQITPQQAIKLAETCPTMTPKERQKVLALAILQISKSYIELKMLWDFSTMVCKLHGYELPAFDPRFILDINKNPSGFAEYR